MNNLVTKPITSTSNISYIQLGRLVVINIYQLIISGSVALDVPPPSLQMTFTARNVDNGDLAMFWISGSGDGKLALQVYKATGYTPGNRYNACFVYIAAS